MFLIRHKVTGQWWSTPAGWVGSQDLADTYNAWERVMIALPLDGEWVGP